MEVANTLAFYNMATNTNVKGFIVQAPPGLQSSKTFLPKFSQFWPNLIRFRLKLVKILPKCLMKLAKGLIIFYYFGHYHKIFFLD